MRSFASSLSNFFATGFLISGDAATCRTRPTISLAPQPERNPTAARTHRTDHVPGLLVVALDEHVHALIVPEPRQHRRAGLQVVRRQPRRQRHRRRDGALLRDGGRRAVADGVRHGRRGGAVAEASVGHGGGAVGRDVDVDRARVWIDPQPVPRLDEGADPPGPDDARHPMLLSQTPPLSRDGRKTAAAAAAAAWEGSRTLAVIAGCASRPADTQTHAKNLQRTLETCCGREPGRTASVADEPS